jgi:hypothetical protein
MSDSRITGTLAITGQSDPCHGRKIDVIITGTWTGTVTVERKTGASTWLDIGESWTGNDSYVIDGSTPGDYRLSFARSSGTLVYNMWGDVI